MDALPANRTWQPFCSHGTYQHEAITSHSRQLLMVGTWLPETCWETIRREIKNTKSDIYLGFLIHTELRCTVNHTSDLKRNVSWRFLKKKTSCLLPVVAAHSVISKRGNEESERNCRFTLFMKAASRQPSKTHQDLTRTCQAQMMRVLIDFKCSEAASSTDDSQMSNVTSYSANWHHVAICVTTALGK